MSGGREKILKLVKIYFGRRDFVVDCHSNAMDDCHPLRERRGSGANSSRARAFLNDSAHSGIRGFGHGGFLSGRSPVQFDCRTLSLRGKDAPPSD